MLVGQALGDGFPLGLGLVVEDKPTELSCTPQASTSQNHDHISGLFNLSVIENRQERSEVDAE